MAEVKHTADVEVGLAAAGPHADRAPPSADAGKLIYAVGDVHGRLDLLLAAADAIEAHLNGRHGKVIFLGDYVDRGPESKGVVEFLIQAQRDGSLTCLKGNHEDMMVKALRDPEDQGAAGHWLGNGGFATLTSYGGRFEDVPEEHIAWMADLPLMATDDYRIYVHAGLMPGVPADQQDDETCLWIRDRFLRASGDSLPRHVVHGHTPRWAGKPDAASPELLPHRTNLDTAAFATGVLTVGVFDPERSGGPVEVLRVTAPSAKEALASA